MRGGGPHRAVQQYAVNGALHYGLAVLDEGTYSEVIIIGINGWELIDGRLINPELKAYYIAQKNGKVPKENPNFEFSLPEATKGASSVPCSFSISFTTFVVDISFCLIFPPAR